jgi:hypothetical protein
LPVSAEAADANGSLVLIGNEWLAYEGAELIGLGKYRLGGLRRGRLGTEAAAHEAGTNFVRFEQLGGWRYGYHAQDVGRTLYIKLPAKNIFGANLQGLENLPVYQYTVM